MNTIFLRARDGSEGKPKFHEKISTCRLRIHQLLANANGANPLVIITPCHCVTQKNGHLEGYTRGTDHKEWLLAHEKTYRF